MGDTSDEQQLTHIAFILDGNRRWAADHKLPKLEGHRRGYENLKDIAQKAFDRGVKYVSAYVFSTENWHRSKREVKYLMDLAYQVYGQDIEELHAKGVKIVWLGNREEPVSPKLRKVLEAAEERTSHNTAGTLCICFNYGGRQEIVEAVRSALHAGVEAAEMNPDLLKRYMYSADIPDPDLIIRTSGEQRLSNFLLWGSAYAELLFVPMHWPDFDEVQLDKALEAYHNRTRRFGS